MKTFKPTFILTAACVLALAGTVALAQRTGGGKATPAPAKKSGFDKFELVKTRNIFDPNRKPYVAQATQPPRTGFTRPTYTPRPAPDYVALTGVMVTEEKVLAFFSGTRADYNKVLGVDSSIAGATIKKISASGIEVERDGKPVTVAVGQTVPLDDSPPGAPPVALETSTAPVDVSAGAPADPNAMPAAPSGTNPEAVSAGVPIGTSDGLPVAPGTATAPPNPSAPATDPGEVMRRMIERRQQQLK